MTPIARPLPGRADRGGAGRRGLAPEPAPRGEPLVRGLRDDSGPVGHAGRRPPQPGRPGCGARPWCACLFAAAALVPVTFTHFAVVFPRPAARRPRAGPDAHLRRPVHVGPGVLARGSWPDVRLQKADYIQPVYGPAFRLLGALHDPLLHLGPRAPGGEAPARHRLRPGPAPLRLPRSRPDRDRRPHSRRRRAARHRILAASACTGPTSRCSGSASPRTPSSATGSWTSAWSSAGPRPTPRAGC